MRCAVSLDDSVALVRRYVDALNAGDLAALDELFADDFVIHQPSGVRRGRAAMRGFVAAVRRRLPDIAARVEAIFADDAFGDGHRVGVLLVYDATDPQIGRRVTVRELQLYRVVGGKIAERWYAADRRAARGEAGPAVERLAVGAVHRVASAPQTTVAPLGRADHGAIAADSGRPVPLAGQRAARRIASATRTASRVGPTSCVRTTCAPLKTATAVAAREPVSRSSGGRPPRSEPRKRLRETPTRIGRPSRRSRARPRSSSRSQAAAGP